MVFVQVFLSWLMADFLTGIIHWFEDRYLSLSSRGLFRSIAADNELHHNKPTAMLLHSWWGNIRLSAMIAWPIALLMFAIGVHWMICLAAFLTAFGNLVHRWSHTPISQLPRVIVFLQDIGVFLSREQHEIHHRDSDGLIPKSRASNRYCAMSDMVNPVLDAYNLFGRAEKALSRLGINTIDKAAAI